MEFQGNPEHLAKLKEGIEAWNAWRSENPDIKPNLNGATLKNANLERKDYDSFKGAFRKLLEVLRVEV